MKKDMVAYDGSKSHISTYNFCFLCKERLDTYHDDQDEGWYFIDTRQVRFTKSSSSHTGKAINNHHSGAVHTPGSVVNVHTSCLKEIEELSFAASQSESQKK
jgi:hypothetical protein